MIAYVMNEIIRAFDAFEFHFSNYGEDFDNLSQFLKSSPTKEERNNQLPILLGSLYDSNLEKKKAFKVAAAIITLADKEIPKALGLDNE